MDMELWNHERTKMKNVVCLLVITMLTATVASVGIVGNNNVLAASLLEKRNFEGTFAFLADTMKEGSITTSVSVFAASAISDVCVSIGRVDESTNTGLIQFSACGPYGNLKVANGLTSASFSGTVTGNEFFSGQQMSVKVNAQLSGAGKVETSQFNFHDNNPFVTTVVTGGDKSRPATGSITVSGDITVNTDDATGSIGDFKQGQLQVFKKVQ